MPVVEKMKKPVADPVAPVAVAEDLSIEKPKARKPATEAMKEAGRKNLEKGRLALQEKRKALGQTPKTPTAPKAEPKAEPKVEPAPVSQTPRTRSKKVIYQEESDSEDEVVIIKKKKKAPKKVIYQEVSDDDVPVVKKTPKTEPVAEPPRQYVQPTAVLRWI